MLFASLRRAFTLPKDLAAAVRDHGSGGGGSSSWQEVLATHQILIPETDDEELYSLSERRPGGWTNSRAGESLLSSGEQALVVLDAVSFEDLRAAPAGIAFLYLGDAFGGFRAHQTRTSDGRIPCPRCLTLRYLAGRKALPALYRALSAGARIAFPLSERAAPAVGAHPVEVFGEDSGGFDEVLPLADCADCLSRAPRRSLRPGLFAPVRRLLSSGSNHAAHLPEMVWLAGEETVGGGGCHDADPARGQARAMHEALERYAAHFSPASARGGGDIVFTSASGPRAFPVRRALLTEPGSLSTGLACHQSLSEAIAHALAEVCERDALARFWLSLLQGCCRLHPLDSWREDELATSLFVLDSYHVSTVLCLGETPEGNVVTGSAGGALEEASEKALAECLQSAAYLRAHAPPSPADPPRTFEEHASLYWHGHYKMPDLTPFLVPEALAPEPLPTPVYHCELTPPDIALMGLHAVRVQVPGLLHLPMSHEDWPSLLEEAGWPDLRAPVQPHPFP